MLSRRSACLILATSLISPGAASAVAAEYPTKPIRLVVPYGPGTGSDVLGRIIAQRLSVELGKSVVVDNRPAAASRLPTSCAARQLLLLTRQRPSNRLSKAAGCFLSPLQELSVYRFFRALRRSRKSASMASTSTRGSACWHRRVSPLRSLRSWPRSVVLGCVAFAALVQPAGFAPALAACVLLASIAHPGFRLFPSVILTSAVVLASWLIFVVGLGLPWPLLGPWLTGN
jgi:tripartite tricarboxylate transporter TctB family protein